jgi:hypothetical protein
MRLAGLDQMDRIPEPTNDHERTIAEAIESKLPSSRSGRETGRCVVERSKDIMATHKRIDQFIVDRSYFATEVPKAILIARWDIWPFRD